MCMLHIMIDDIEFFFFYDGMHTLTQTRSHNDHGEYQAARIASRQARLFNRLSILVGVLIWLVVFICCQIGWIIPVAIALALAKKNNTTLHTT